MNQVMHDVARDGVECLQVEPSSRDGAMWGWQQHAACRGQDTTYFFAPNYFEKKRQKDGREAKAKALCAQCPVRDVCLEYALKINEEHGVWGGLNEQERRQLVRRRAMGIQELRAG